MSSDPSSSEQRKINLNERFPSMRPVTSAPALTTVNGIGLGVYGHRDEDTETGAYVKTHCLCIFFIPVLAFGAYRVVDSREGGWYFLGKEPLSTFAKAWNALVVCLLLAGAGGIAWNEHVTSPEYVARHDLHEAQAQLQSGNALKAAGSFARLLTGPASAEARPGLQTALEQCLHSPSLHTNEGAFRLLSQLGTGVNRPAPLVPEAFQRGLALVEKAGPADPDSALKLLDTVALLEPKNESLPQRRIDLLRAVVQAQPTNITRVVELALTYEKAQRMKDCHELLLRHRDHLGRHLRGRVHVRDARVRGEDRQERLDRRQAGVGLLDVRGDRFAAVLAGHETPPSLEDVTGAILPPRPARPPDMNERRGGRDGECRAGL